MIRAMVGLLMFSAVLPASNLDTVKAEPDPEKRARAALEFANSSISSARSAYMDSEYKKAFAALNDVTAGAELCLESLDATGKNARRNPKSFKRAEMQINEMLRRLRSLESDFGVDDRPQVARVSARLQEIHDALITRIMGKKK